MDIYNIVRPKTYEEMIDTSRAIKVLRKHSKDGKFPKAMIFIGPAGTGKSSAAKILPYAVNCTSENKPCGKCKACEMAENDPSIICETINASDCRGIDDIRELAKRMQVGNMFGLSIVYILNEAEQLTKDAQKAFKEPLENLHKNAYVVMTTNNIKGIIPELQDRCQVYNFHGASVEESIQLVQRAAKHTGIKINPEEISKLISASDGRRPRNMLQLLQRFRDEGSDALEIQNDADDTSPIGQIIRVLIYKDPYSVKSGKEYSITFKEIRGYIDQYLMADSAEKLRRILLGAVKNTMMSAEKLDKMFGSTKQDFAGFKYELICNIFMPELSYGTQNADIIFRIFKYIKAVIMEKKRMHNESQIG